MRQKSWTIMNDQSEKPICISWAYSSVIPADVESFSKTESNSIWGFFFVFLCLFVCFYLGNCLSFGVMWEIWASPASLINLLIAFFQPCEWLRSSSSGTHIIQQKLEWMWKRERAAAYWKRKQSSHPTIFKFKTLYTYLHFWLKLIKSLKINPYFFCCTTML